jgi:hypothetical protein
MSTDFPDTPAIIVFDPLAELLGAGDGRFTYRFEDAVKLAGHACPTVAGAFLMATLALDALYGSETPRRGGVRIDFPGPVDRGVNGPIAQIFTLVTGAAGDNGFQGLGGRHARRGLMRFGDGPDGPIRFQRMDTGATVSVTYDPAPIPPDPHMVPLLQRIQQGTADPGERQHFRDLWRDGVLRILADGGRQTVRLVHDGATVM